MTTFTQARDAAVAALVAVWPTAYPAVPMFFDNATAPDVDTLTEFLTCQIGFSRSVQAEIGYTPSMRTYGNVTFILGVRAMKGYRPSLARADFLSDTYRFSNKQGVVFQAPHLLPPVEKDGWFLTELIVPFFFDG